MKATLSKEKVTNAKWDKHRKSDWPSNSYLVTSKHGSIVEAHYYYNPKADGMSRTYAIIQVYSLNHECEYFTGSGFASGCGYDKESAAMADAIESAGISLDEDISGRGKPPLREALEAIAKAQLRRIGSRAKVKLYAISP